MGVGKRRYDAFAMRTPLSSVLMFVVAALLGAVGQYLAWWAYGEPVKPVNVAGMALLVAGMFLMGR